MSVIVLEINPLAPDDLQERLCSSWLTGSLVDCKSPSLENTRIDRKPETLHEQLRI